LPVAPANSSSDAAVATPGASAPAASRILRMSRLPVAVNNRKTPSRNAASPIRLTMKALRPAVAAAGRWNQ
jgi:hypothetical protein